MTDRFVCTKDNPWSKDKAERATHPDAKWVRDYYYEDGGGKDVYECPNCKLTFSVEIPQ